MCCAEIPPQPTPFLLFRFFFFYVWFVFKGLKKVCTIVSFCNRFTSCWLSFLQTVLRQGGDRKDEGCSAANQQNFNRTTRTLPNAQTGDEVGNEKRSHNFSSPCSVWQAAGANYVKEAMQVPKPTP